MEWQPKLKFGECYREIIVAESLEHRCPKLLDLLQAPLTPETLEEENERNREIKRSVSKKGNRTKKRVQEDTERGKRVTGRTETQGQEEKNNKTRNFRDNKRNERKMGKKELRREKTRTRRKEKTKRRLLEVEKRETAKDVHE